MADPPADEPTNPPTNPTAAPRQSERVQPRRQAKDKSQPPILKSTDASGSGSRRRSRAHEPPTESPDSDSEDEYQDDPETPPKKVRKVAATAQASSTTATARASQEQERTAKRSKKLASGKGVAAAAPISERAPGAREADTGKSGPGVEVPGVAIADPPHDVKQPDLDFTCYDERWVEFVTNFSSADDPTLKITHRMKSALIDSKLKTLVLPSNDENPAETTLSEFLLPQPTPRRTFHWTIKQKNSRGKWEIRYDQVGSRRDFASKSIYFSLPFSEVPTNARSDAERVASAFGDYLTRWPLPTWNTGNKGGITILTNAAIAKSLNRGKCIPAPVYTGKVIRKNDATALFSQTIRYIDPTTGTQNSLVLRLGPGPKNLQGVRLHPLPSDLRIFKLKSRSQGTIEIFKFANGKWPSDVPDDVSPSVRQDLERCEEVTRIIGFHLDGIVATSARVAELIDYWRHFLGVKGHPGSGMFLLF